MSGSRQACFEQLEQLYVQLEQRLPKAAGNPCGSCRQCCTGRGLTAHNVTQLELDFIRHHEGEQRLPAFSRFLARDGTVELCPFFDEELWGCGIYARRPYSCRVFGHHKAAHTALPELCVFQGREQTFALDDFYQAVPMAAELRDLVRDYWPFQHHGSQDKAIPGDGLGRMGPKGDALDRALMLMSQDRLQEALEEFEASQLPSTPYVLYCLSLVFEGLGRHSDASTALGVALDQAPDCTPLWFRQACNLHALGHFQPAEAAFRRTLELDPDHALAQGLLGSHLVAVGRREEGVGHLARAVALAPGLESFARLLQAVSREPSDSAVALDGI